MATLTIRRLDDEVKRRLRIRAAANGRSMEEEARLLLDRALGPTSDRPRTGKGLGTEIRRIAASVGGIELDLPPRTTRRGVARFGDESGAGE